MRNKLEEEIQSVLPAGSAGAEIIIEKGDPPGKIEEVTGQFRAPLIVLPTHGFGPFRRFLLGSVTTKVLHDLTCPVYTGAHIEDDAIFAKAEARHVACAIDLREHSEAVLTWAWAYAQRWSASLTVIHAVNWLETSPLDENLFTAELTERLLASAELQARELMAKVGCGGDLKMQVESAEDYIPQAVKECGADVLVIGRSLERGMVGRLREHAYKLIRESPVPVISV
jgi:nucleotide-binding universal stress UspA family protein